MISKNIQNLPHNAPIPELLSPAGNPEKLKYALLYGADAVYLAGRSFGMRSAAGNFSDEELYDAVKLAHSLGKKIYVTVNTMPRSTELPLLEEYLEKLNDIKPDALIVADLGVMSMCLKRTTGIELHVSTQGAVTNYESCRMWHDLGAQRVVLARELSLDEIADIRSKTPSTLQLETFVHGAMCVSVSGRCLLSEYYVDRDANRGSCAQPCRWIYEFSEVKRPNDILTGEVHKEGTYIFGSKDMCLIEHIPELCKAGISSFKIEGRMKSSYYTAVVTNAYRIAMDHHFGIREDISSEELNALLVRELDSVSHREYCTGYYFHHPMEEPQLTSVPGYMRETSYMAAVEDYDPETNMALCTQKNKMRCGERAEILSPGKTGRGFIIGEMFDSEGVPITETPHPQMSFSLKAPFELKRGDIIRAVAADQEAK